jgi:hypothetical protein
MWGPWGRGKILLSAGYRIFIIQSSIPYASHSTDLEIKIDFGNGTI